MLKFDRGLHPASFTNSTEHGLYYSSGFQDRHIRKTAAPIPFPEERRRLIAVFNGHAERFAFNKNDAVITIIKCLVIHTGVSLTHCPGEVLRTR